MPRRTQTRTKSASIAHQKSVIGGKTISKNAKTNPIGLNKCCRRDMRFSVSLVILIGMLAFSVMLLIFSLNERDVRNAKAQMNFSAPKPVSTVPAKASPANSTKFSGAGGNFQLSIPVSWKGWVYRAGQVKSPIDDNLSDSYIKIYLPLTVADNTEVNSPNLDSRYKDIITILTYSADEWKAMEKKCNRSNSDACDDMGTKLADTQCSDSEGDSDCIYSYIKQPNCGGSIEGRCKDIDKIMESFQLTK
ncbi:MAG TPA: hypothetical protein VK254_04500 [Candidatus Bathyarchaeia archaeon]|nr:hypothetical protein [Candidatus Bathyarchaeia archaeon]